jgi:hypothetical protein
LQVPIDVLLSCREDDVLLLPEITQWCVEGEIKGVRNFTLLLTAANSDAPIFPDGPSYPDPETESKLQGLTNARVLRSRLTSTIVAESMARLQRRCRVVVSGPDTFNSAARNMLTEFVDDEDITVLSS